MATDAAKAAGEAATAAKDAAAAAGKAVEGQVKDAAQALDSAINAEQVPAPATTTTPTN